MLDLIAEDRIRKERDRFIDGIDEQAIRQLASQHHNGDACYFFKPPTRGSFNMCYFVRFPNNESWVIRVPLQPYLASDSRQKVEREVATMRLIAEQTNIPIPRIIAHSLDGGAFGIDSFLILEFVDGRPLSDFKGLGNISRLKRTILYEHLADIYLQLRRLTFPAIGALTFASDGAIHVGRGPISIEFNMQDLAGLQPSSVRDFRSQGGVLWSAKDYISALLSMTRNAFEKSPSSIQDEDDGNQMLYYLHSFDHFVKEWVDNSLDNGPFILTHGDFFDHNLLVDDNMCITAVLDWEWSHVVPLQFFNPPLWLITKSTGVLTSPKQYQYHIEELDEFRAVLRRREAARYGNTLLSDEWASIHERGGILAAAALEGMDLEVIYYFGCRFLNNFEVPTSAINEFMAEDPGRVELIAKKVKDGEAYDAECKRLGLGEFADGNRESGHTTLETKHISDEKQPPKKAPTTWSIQPSSPLSLSILTASTVIGLAVLILRRITQ